MSIVKTGLVGVGAFVAFSVVWIATMISGGSRNAAIGMGVLFSPQYWLLSVAVALGCAVLYGVCSR